MERLIQVAFSELIQSGSLQLGNKAFVTVTEVQLNSSLEEARVYLSTFHALSPSDCFSMLSQQLPHIHNHLAQLLRNKLRRMPRIVLVHDDSQVRALRIDQLLKGE